MQSEKIEVTKVQVQHDEGERKFGAVFESSLTTVPCAKCEGMGIICVPDGEDDFDEEECRFCGGTGRVVA